MVNLWTTPLGIQKEKVKEKKFAELEIKGHRDYIRYMEKHLKKEHPSTRERMEVEY